LATKTLRIDAKRLGTTTEIRNFLTDIENVYNICYVIDRIENAKSVNLKSLVQPPKKRIPPKLNRGIEDFAEYRLPMQLANILSEPSKSPSRITTKIQKEVPRSEQLIITKINIQSPGFWEFLGGLNPLTQNREFLKDRHERKKDKDYRIAQEKRKGELEIASLQLDLVQKYIATCEKAGFTNEQIRDGAAKFIQEPIRRLGAHQDSGLIDGPIGE